MSGEIGKERVSLDELFDRGRHGQTEKSDCERELMGGGKRRESEWALMACVMELMSC